MHDYINTDLRLDFSKPKTRESIFEDLTEKYCITNIKDDGCDSLNGITEALLWDYENKFSNYEAYIEYKQNGRVLMELRKSAMIPCDVSLYDFYTGLRGCDTVEDIRNFRINYLKRFNSDYKDANWQNYLLTVYLWGRRSLDYMLDFECCFADSTATRQTDRDDYRQDFINAHLKGYKGWYI